MPANENKIDETMRGSVDFHMHSHMSPAFHWNLAEIGRRSQAAGLRAVVVKNLYGFSHEQCHMANQMMGNDMFYASLVLGKTTGGICTACVADEHPPGYLADRVNGIHDMGGRVMVAMKRASRRVRRPARVPTQ